MNYRSFGAAAYSKAGNKDKNKDNDNNKKVQDKAGETVGPAGTVGYLGTLGTNEKLSYMGATSDSSKTNSFQPVGLANLAKSDKKEAFSKSEKAQEKSSIFSAFTKNTVPETEKSNKPLWEKKISTPVWGKINTKTSNLDKTIENKKEPKESKKEKNSFSTLGEGVKPSPSQRLENATDYLKSGGLIKVPVEESAGGKDSIYRKVAKFLVLIGEEEAAKVLPHLSEKQIERIIPEIASIRTVSKEEAAVIFEEFNSIVKQVKQQGGVETAREMLIKAYGKKRAEEMIKKAMPMEGKVPFAYLNDLDNERLYLLLKDENVGVQALALSHINPKKSAKVINLMSDEGKKEIVMRLAKMEPVSPEVLRRVDQAMHEKSMNQTVEESENIDGRNALAQILKKMDISAENEILSTLSEDDPDLGKDLRSRLFTLDDVVNADDRFIQEKLREMSEVDIAYLISGKSQDFIEKILSNISANRRYEVRSQDQILSVKRKADVDKITSDFLAKLRFAYEAGDLIIHDRNDDEFV